MGHKNMKKKKMKTHMHTQDLDGKSKGKPENYSIRMYVNNCIKTRKSP